MKVMQICLAIVLGLAGLAMTTCGLVFSFAGTGEAVGVLVLSIPSLLIGIFVLWIAKKVWPSAGKAAAPVAAAAAPAPPPGQPK